MRFRSSFTKNFNTSSFLRMTQSGINSAMSVSMFRNKVFHDTVATIMTRASIQACSLKVITSENSTPVQADLLKLSSLNGLIALIQFIKTVPSLSMLAMLNLLNSGMTN